MPITFKGKNIQELYQSGSKIIIANALSIENPPTNEFEKNFPNGIKINGKDINELAISKYTHCNTTIAVPCAGYKHFSAFGRGGTGGSGGRGGDNKCHGPGNGGAGGLGGTFGILKYPLPVGTNTINVTIGGAGGSGGAGNSGQTCRKYGDGGDGNSGNQTLIAIGGSSIAAGLGGGGGGGGNGATSSNNGNTGGQGGAGGTLVITGATDAKAIAPNLADSPYARIYLHCE